MARRCDAELYAQRCNCRNVSDASVVLLAECCPKLRYLDLHGTGITDASIKALAACCPQLRCVACSDTKVTKAGQRLARGLSDRPRPPPLPADEVDRDGPPCKGGMN